MRATKRLKITLDQHAGPGRDQASNNSYRSPTHSPYLDATLHEANHVLPYTAIDSEHGDFRLLELAPGRFEDQLVIRLVKRNLLRRNELTYEALSYVWGTVISDNKALLNGVPVSITENLDCALRHLRYKIMTRTLWVDALSMNQSNIQERNHQVQMMGRIYSKAERVNVWLGPVDDNDVSLKVVLAAMQFQFANLSPSITTLFDYTCSIIALLNQQAGRTLDCKQCTLDAISRIIDRPWFQRVWVVQELALSQVATVHVGTYTFPWEPFQQFINWLPHHRIEPHSNRKFCEMAARVTKAPTRGRFSQQLCRTLHLSATDPRDKVFSLLGISRMSATSITADYTKSVTEVYMETTAMMLRENDFRIYMFAPLQPLRNQQLSTPPYLLPSWVPDLQTPGATFADSFQDPVVTAQDVNTYHCPFTLVSGLTRRSISKQMQKFSSTVPKRMTRVLLDEEGFAKLYTPGRYLGTIAKTSGTLLNSLSNVTSFSEPINTLHDVYETVIAPYGGRAYDLIYTLLTVGSGGLLARSDKLRSWLIAKLEGRSINSKEALNPSRALVNESNALITATAKDRVIFITFSGIVGISYHPEPHGIRPGDQLVDLFGINFPFILRKNADNETWRMINVAGYSGHRWSGHALPDDMNFSDQDSEDDLNDDDDNNIKSEVWCKKRSMQRYVIV